MNDSPLRADKRRQPSVPLVVKRLRITPQTAKRVEAYRRLRDHKPEADALRDLVFEGLKALNVAA